jgi:acyl-coenzyme A thioesterase PaaI-like protein
MAKDSAFPTPSISPGGVPLCWGCAPAGQCQIGIKTIDVNAPTAAAWATAQCPASWQGGPGVAHGGWICSVFDEVFGRLPSALDVPRVTASLQVSFIRPIPIERPIVVTAEVARRNGRRWAIRGVMRLDRVDDRREFARGTAELVEPQLDHFDKVSRTYRS